MICPTFKGGYFQGDSIDKAMNKIKQGIELRLKEILKLKRKNKHF